MAPRTEASNFFWLGADFFGDGQRAFDPNSNPLSTWLLI